MSRFWEVVYYGLALALDHPFKSVAGLCLISFALGALIL